MDEDEFIDQVYADLVGDLPDMSDDQIMDAIDKYDLDDDDKVNLFQLIKDIQSSEAGQPLDLPQNMANEDGTAVTVTEIDKDDDGDVDKQVTEKKEPENDESLSEEEKDLASQIASEDNSSETDDKPHDENKTNQIAKTLSDYRF